jgi:hypothetical protein
LHRASRCVILMVPGETEAGSAGEQPAKGYPGQAHRTTRTNEPGEASHARPGHPRQLIGRKTCDVSQNALETLMERPPALAHENRRLFISR